MGNILPTIFTGGKTPPDEIDVTRRYYGWVRDTPDNRDSRRMFGLPHPSAKYVKLVDLRDKCPPVYNQGHLGSCTANGIAAVYEFDQMRQGEDRPFVPSRLFIYYNERQMEGTIDQDSGAQIRDGMKSIHNIGVCPENMWSYDISKFTVRPDDQCYIVAKNHRSIVYHRVNQILGQLQRCLLNGFPIVFGFTVYQSFESPEVATTGIMPMPTSDEKLLGGHCVVAVGYDDNRKMFIIRNSWGTEWGDGGYFYMPYEFITNEEYCSDFWCLERIQDQN